MNSAMLHAGILNDTEIQALCEPNDGTAMIEPFIPRQEGHPSYGLGSFGYDIRLGYHFLEPIEGDNILVDPLNFPRARFQRIEAHDYLDIAPHSMVLAESEEWFNLPEDIFAVVYGKSTYARCGLLVNVTPGEPQWKGRWTLELNNVSPLPIRLYVGRGIAQVIFFRGERPGRTYTEKEAGGIYQYQTGVTPPR